MAVRNLRSFLLQGGAAALFTIGLGVLLSACSGGSSGGGGGSGGGDGGGGGGNSGSGTPGPATLSPKVSRTSNQRLPLSPATVASQDTVLEVTDVVIAGRVGDPLLGQIQVTDLGGATGGRSWEIENPPNAYGSLTGDPRLAFLSSNLPLGLSLSSTGAITGIPSGPAGIYYANVVCLDGATPPNVGVGTLEIQISPTTTNLGVKGLLIASGPATNTSLDFNVDVDEVDAPSTGVQVAYDGVESSLVGRHRFRIEMAGPLPTSGRLVGSVATLLVDNPVDPLDGFPETQYPDSRWTIRSVSRSDGSASGTRIQYRDQNGNNQIALANTLPSGTGRFSVLAEANQWAGTPVGTSEVVEFEITRSGSGPADCLAGTWEATQGCGARQLLTINPTSATEGTMRLVLDDCNGGPDQAVAELSFDQRNGTEGGTLQATYTSNRIGNSALPLPNPSSFNASFACSSTLTAPPPNGTLVKLLTLNGIQYRRVGP